ncbi:hypothetical protein Tco_1470178 [Tanacetum coccineum]
MPPKPDLSFSGLEEFVNEPIVSEPTVKKPVVETSVAKASEAKPKEVRKNNGAPIIKDWESDNEEDDQEKTARKTSKQVEQLRQNTHTPRGNQRNWNNMISQRLGMNVARRKSHFSKSAYSTAKRPIHKNTTFKNSNFNQRVNTVKDKNVNTVKPKAVVNAVRPKAVVNVVKGNNVNVVKALACWVWKPKTKGNPQIDLHDQGVIVSGCSRHMTGNMSYLTNFEEIDRGYVSFGGNPKGGKITSKVPRKSNMYSVDLKNIVPKGGLTCHFAKAT